MCGFGNVHKNLVGIPYDDRFVRRLLEQARNGRSIVRLFQGLSRLAGRGVERGGIEADRKAGTIENVRNSIAPRSGMREEAAAQAEEEQPGILQEISALMERAVNAFEDGRPPPLPWEL